MALDIHVGCKKGMANNSFEDLCSSAEPHWMTKKNRQIIKSREFFIKLLLDSYLIRLIHIELETLTHFIKPNVFTFRIHIYLLLEEG